MNQWLDGTLVENLKPIIRLPASGITLVEELLNPDTGELNEDVVEANVVPVDAHVIL